LFVGPICADGGLHDVQDLHGGGYSNPERRGRGGKIARGNLRLLKGLRKTPARCRRYTAGVERRTMREAGSQSEIPVEMSPPRSIIWR
jgi:hypothetical protein